MIVPTTGRGLISVCCMRQLNHKNPSGRYLEAAASASECPRLVHIPSPRILPGGRRGTDNRSMSNRPMSKRNMPQNEWQRRIARAEELGAQYSFSAEILRFYVAIARFQEKFYEELGRSFERSRAGSVESEPFARPLHPELTNRFESFWS